MTTITDHLPRTSAVRLAGWLVKAPRVVLAALLWLLIIEAMPAPAGVGVLLVVAVGTVTAVVAEPVMVRVVWWALRPATALQVPGDPQVVVLLTSRRAAGIASAGRRHLIVASAWVGRPDLPALLARARSRQLVAAGRLDVAYQWFTWPWQLLASFAGGFARGLSTVPLVGFAWRMRVVVVGVGVWQSVVAGRLVAAVGIVVVAGLTYLLPWTRRHHERLVDQVLSAHDQAGAAEAESRQAAHAPRRMPVVVPAPCGGQAAPVRSSSCGRQRHADGRVSCLSEGARGRGHGHRPIGTKGSPS